MDYCKKIVENQNISLVMCFIDLIAYVIYDLFQIVQF